MLIVRKNEDDIQAAELAGKLSELKRGERKIRKLEMRYELLRNSKPLPANAVELSPAGIRAAAIAKVKDEILESMKDPASAMFRRISSSPEGSLICGEVNAKNSMGGYVGFRKFINVGIEWDDFTFYEETGASTLAAACEKQEGKK